VLQVDLAIAFPIIDLLLGGEGKGGDLGRPITEIEEQLLEASCASSAVNCKLPGRPSRSFSSLDSANRWRRRYM